MTADLDNELARGLALQEAGKNRQALEAFDRVIAAADRVVGAEAEELVAAGWQGKCQVLVREKRWAETLDAASACAALYGERPGLKFRWVVADARRMHCLATAALSVSATGQRGASAFAEQDSLIEWLRGQPETRFRPELAWQLADKVRWRAGEDEALDALDELVGVLAKLGDVPAPE